MKPYVHSKRSAHKFGGEPSDYTQIHEFFDMTKAAHADMRHRAILHNSMGVYIAALAFGDEDGNMTRKSDGKKVSVRDVGEQHVLDDLGTIPALSDILKHMPLLDVLTGRKRIKRFDLVD